MRTNKKTKKEVRRFFEYFITGGLWFWTGYILIVTLDNHLGLFAANLIGNGVGLSVNFLLERIWVFRSKRPAKLAITAKRYVIYTVLNAFLLNYLILYYLRKGGIEPEIGQFIAAGFFTVWNYVWYRAWVFRGQERPRRTRHHA